MTTMERPSVMPIHGLSPVNVTVATPAPAPAPVAVRAESEPSAAAPATLSRQQILQTTCQCLREHGYDGTTIRRIASSIGCAIGSIYRYYTDKRELLYEVTQQVIEPVAAMIEQGGDFAGSVRLYAEAATRENEAYRLLFWLACHVDDRGPSDAAAPTALPGVVRRVVDGWARLLGDADLARRHWAMLHGCLIAGLDVEQTLAAMRTLRAVRREAHPAASEPQVVTVMRVPPQPRQDHGSEAPAAAGPHAEDVCLL